MSGFLVGVGVIVLGLLSTIWSGFVLTYLWRWFVVPFGVGEISIPHAIGVILVVGYLTTRITKEDLNTPEGEGAYKIAVKLLYAAIVFGVGWIVQLFM